MAEIIRKKENKELKELVDILEDIQAYDAYEARCEYEEERYYDIADHLYDY